MKQVQVESPYAGDVEKNIEYARKALRDCLRKNEAPYASHLLYTQPGVLDDTVPEERQYGIDAGLIFAEKADVSIFYIDCGFSSGMKYGLKHALKFNRECVFRSFVDSDGNVIDIARDVSEEEIEERFNGLLT